VQAWTVGLSPDNDAQIQIDLATHRVQMEPVSADATELEEAIKEVGHTPIAVATADLQAAAPAQGGNSSR
jgi:copper chaperone